MSELIEKAAQAVTWEEAVRVLTEGGMPRDRAEEIAAIMFGDSDGDVVALDADSWRP